MRTWNRLIQIADKNIEFEIKVFYINECQAFVEFTKVKL